jgi:hypothetical protein
MSNPIINSLSASMTNYQSSVPMVAVTFNLQDANASLCHVEPSGFQYYVEKNGEWKDALLHSSSDNRDSLMSYSEAPGFGISWRWDAKSDENEFLGQARIRVNVINTDGLESGYQTTGFFNVKTTSPTVGLSLPDNANTSSIIFTPTMSSDVTSYRISESIDFSGANWMVYNRLSPSMVYQFVLPNTEGDKRIYVMAKDSYFNTSSTCTDSIFLHKTPPAFLFSSITGTVPDNQSYTGISVMKDGSFVPDRRVNVKFYATDSLDMQVKITGDVEAGPNTGVWIPYKTGHSILVDNLDVTLSGTDFNYDASASIVVTFRDAVGNESSISKIIRLNTKIFKCSNRLLRAPSSEYDHQVYEANQDGNSILLAKNQAVQNVYKKKWNDIFYPTSHSYPVNADGTMNISQSISMSQTSTSFNDAVQLADGAIVYDTQGRVSTVNWTSDGTKDYMANESSSTPRHWIVDNSGYGDIVLEFEHFHLNPNAYNLPPNRNKPKAYNGDCLIIYDASDPLATQSVTGSDGNTSYVLSDSSKLVQLYVYTGSGIQVMELGSGYSANANANGGFVTPPIALGSGNNRICMILYSDASHQDSGFKLKGGPRHNVTFVNYDMDDSNGELWLHKYPDGRSYDGAMRMVYDYMDSDIKYDYDAGRVIFAVQPSGIVTADYSHYVNTEDMIPMDFTRLFVSSFDDYVDYLDVYMYATPSGQQLGKIANYDFTAPKPSGKVSSNFTVDKDRGVVEFNSGVGSGHDEMFYVPVDYRLTMDYYHHTYKRLTNDGYGTLTFKDSTVVADSTPLYPDYTWVDVKLINEGDAILESGALKFLSRGYDADNDGIMDQVLDVNRPWDTQEGTKEETYDKVAMEVRTNYTFSVKPTKTEAMAILSQWKNRSFGFDFYPRTRAYGRICWVLGGVSGSSYPTTSVGRKTFSAEIEGKFYSVQA